MRLHIYGDNEIRVEIETGVIMSGSFPTRARNLVLEWLELHREELREDWKLAELRKPLNKIEPLESGDEPSRKKRGIPGKI